MHPHEQLIERFYQALADGDAVTIGACYADDALFEDPAFGVLSADEARSMWQMLLHRADDLQVAWGGIQADDTRGRAEWEARYTFNGNPVVNRVSAAFGFGGGLIIRHVDTFDWPTWARQALGTPGRLLGNTHFLHNQATKKARAQLEAYRRGLGPAGPPG